MTKKITEGINIRTKNLIFILILVFFMVFINFVYQYQIAKMDTAFNIVHKHLPHHTFIYELNLAVTDYLMPIHDFLITGDQKELELSREQAQQVEEKLILCEQFTDISEKYWVEKIKHDFAKIKSLSEELVTLSSIGNKREIALEMERMDKSTIGLREIISQLLETCDNFMNQAKSDVEQASISAYNWSIIILILTVIFGLFAGIYISSSIINPLQELENTATKITKGELFEEIKIEGKGEITRLAEAFNQMVISLQTQIEKNKILLDTMADGLFTVDLNKRITSFNPSAEKITGFKAEEVIGKPCSILQGDPCTKICNLYNQETKKPILNTECSIISKKGKKITILKSADLLKDHQGNVIGGVESLKNITGRKQLEEKLIIAEKGAAIAELAGATAHELNNPLTSILTFSELLKADIDKNHPSYQKLTTIIEEIERMTEIIKKISTITKYETKTYVGNSKIIDIDKASEEVEK